jgi:hypothetical protein
MEEDLLPNLRFGLQPNFFAASSGESTPTRLKANKVERLAGSELTTNLSTYFHSD